MQSSIQTLSTRQTPLTSLQVASAFKADMKKLVRAMVTPDPLGMGGNVHMTEYAMKAKVAENTALDLASNDDEKWAVRLLIAALTATDSNERAETLDSLSKTVAELQEQAEAA